jgi:hypothetical protein
MDEDDVKDNGGRGVRKIGIHGRAFKMSDSLISRLGGFWFDPANTGVLKNPMPAGMLDYNTGIQKFYEAVLGFGCKIDNALIREYNMFKRNQPVRNIKRKGR